MTRDRGSLLLHWHAWEVHHGIIWSKLSLWCILSTNNIDDGIVSQRNRNLFTSILLLQHCIIWDRYHVAHSLVWHRLLAFEWWIALLGAIFSSAGLVPWAGLIIPLGSSLSTIEVRGPLFTFLAWDLRLRGKVCLTLVLLLLQVLINHRCTLTIVLASYISIC